MTYAIVDVRSHTLTYARAGHCPLMYRRGEDAGRASAGSGSANARGPSDGPSGRHVEIQAPDGLVLGLKIDSGERFNALLREVTLPLGAGDLVLLFTDGVTDAMNAAGEPFGEERLAAVIEEHGDLPFEELRERILREIHAFVGSTGQHDDLTFVLLTVAAGADRDSRVLRFAGARP